jgi:hypothetical protein
MGRSGGGFAENAPASEHVQKIKDDDDGDRNTDHPADDAFHGGLLFVLPDMNVWCGGRFRRTGRRLHNQDVCLINLGLSQKDLEIT